MNMTEFKLSALIIMTVGSALSAAVSVVEFNIPVGFVMWDVACAVTCINLAAMEFYE